MAQRGTKCTTTRIYQHWKETRQKLELIRATSNTSALTCFTMFCGLAAYHVSCRWSTRYLTLCVCSGLLDRNVHEQATDNPAVASHHQRHPPSTPSRVSRQPKPKPHLPRSFQHHLFACQGLFQLLGLLRLQPQSCPLCLEGRPLASCRSQVHRGLFLQGGVE